MSLGRLAFDVSKPISVSIISPMSMSRLITPHRDESPCRYATDFSRTTCYILTTTSATLRLFPGITAATVRGFLNPPTCGLVLETFGAGNAPQRADLMDALKEGCERGVVIVAISQCSKGSVSAEYETGIALLKIGVVSGGDMTPEVCHLSPHTELTLMVLMQCALTKLGYLLSKSDLSVAQVRSLMGTPLRGELTLPASNISKTLNQQADITDSLDNIQGVLTHVVRLSTTKPQGPKIVVESPLSTTLSQSGGDESESAAAWSWTAAEAVSTELALLPLLMHLAAARDDVRGLHFCLTSDSAGSALTPSPDLARAEGTRRSTAVIGGMANCIDPASGRSPLHVAALNGSILSVDTLLEAGALVHLRDALGHTALYYVRFCLLASTLAVLTDMYIVGGETRTRTDRRESRQCGGEPRRVRYRGRLCATHFPESDAYTRRACTTHLAKGRCRRTEEPRARDLNNHTVPVGLKQRAAYNKQCDSNPK
jgi:hypothetical protein